MITKIDIERFGLFSKPKLSGMPKSISIKEAMRVLGGKLVIGGVPKSGNKDDPDPHVDVNFI